jgi:hypothetical protein
MATKTAARKTSTHARKALKGPHKATKAKTAKKPAAKKAAPAKKRSAVKRAKLDLKPIKAKMSKSELAIYLSEYTGSEVSKKQVLTVLEGLAQAMKASVAPRGVGTFQVPGVITIKTKKIKAKTVPAIKKGTMVRNPRTGEESPHPGRKAYVKAPTVKVRAIAMGSLKRAALGTE